jgi:hypothetical protein
MNHRLTVTIDARLLVEPRATAAERGISLNQFLRVDAVALYWGVRRLIFDHTSNRRAASSLDRMIEDSWKRRKAAGLVDTIEAHESGELLFNGKPTTVTGLKRRFGNSRRRH